MNDEPEQTRLVALDKSSSLLGSLATAYLNVRYKGAMTAIAETLGERLREILPGDEYTVDVKGPLLDVKWGRASSVTGIWGLHLLERGTADEKLARAFEEAASSLKNVVAVARREPSRGYDLDPHVRVTDASVDVWWGAPEPEKAIVRLRPMARSELGL